MPPVTPATAGWRSKADNKTSREAAGTWSRWRAENDSDKILTDHMVFKLGLEAQKHWRRLQGFELIPKVVTGVRFVDGEEQTQQAA
jgi:hypothetical protein